MKRNESPSNGMRLEILIPIAQYPLIASKLRFYYPGALYRVILGSSIGMAISFHNRDLTCFYLLLQERKLG